jgi:hypothetical protein
MSEPSLVGPAEPLAIQNSFRQKIISEQRIPSYLDIKDHLPVPVLPEHPGWVEMYWQAWETAWSNLLSPGPNSGLVAQFIGSPYDNSIHLWNSCFDVSFGLYARCHFDLMGTLDNFYARQHDDGFIARTIDTCDKIDVFYPFDPNSTGPNILAWAEWNYYRKTGDDSRLPKIFGPLMAFHRWFRANRTWRDGSYWATGLSSGMHNQPRVPDSTHHHRHWAWVDSTAQAALNCHLLGKMAAHLGEEGFITELSQEHVRLVRLINASMWNEDSAFYQDIDRDGRFSTVKSIGAYWALLDAEIVPEHRLTPFTGQLRESWAFNLPHRVPSQSADSDGYNAETGNQWRGAVWAPTNYMVVKGLRHRGLDGLAHEIAHNHLRNVEKVFQRTGKFWENYAPETAAPGEPSKPDFVGWIGLTPVAMLLEDVIGLNVDWPQKRIVWDRRLKTSGDWGIRHYPLGEEGCLHLVGNKDRVVVNTDAPFTLEIRESGENILVAVPAGTTEIDLS